MPKIVAAVRQILCGEVYLSPHMTTRLLQLAAVGKPLDHSPTEALSNRELQVFEMIGQGMSTVEIAHKLQVSPKTVESHRKVIKTKLNVQTGRAIEPPGLSMGARELLIAEDRRRNNCRLSLRESGAAFAERKATIRR